MLQVRKELGEKGKVVSELESQLEALQTQVDALENEVRPWCFIRGIAATVLIEEISTSKFACCNVTPTGRLSFPVDLVPSMGTRTRSAAQCMVRKAITALSNERIGSRSMIHGPKRRAGVRSFLKKRWGQRHPDLRRGAAEGHAGAAQGPYEDSQAHGQSRGLFSRLLGCYRGEDLQQRICFVKTKNVVQIEL